MECHIHLWNITYKHVQECHVYKNTKCHVFQNMTDGMSCKSEYDLYIECMECHVYLNMTCMYTYISGILFVHL